MEAKPDYESHDAQRDHLLESLFRHGAGILRCFAELLDIEAAEISDEAECSSIEQEISHLQRRLKRMRAR